MAVHGYVVDIGELPEEATVGLEMKLSVANQGDGVAEEELFVLAEGVLEGVQVGLEKMTEVDVCEVAESRPRAEHRLGLLSEERQTPCW